MSGNTGMHKRRRTVIVRDMRWMKRCGLLGLVGVLTVGLLSGCLEVNLKSTVKTDLSGTTMMRLGLSKVALQTVQQGVGPSTASVASAPTPPQMNPFSDVSGQITQMGGTATPYENDKFIGIDISLPFKNLDEMQQQLTAVLGTPGGSSSPPLLTITAKQTANGVRIDGKVDPSLGGGDPAMSAMGGSGTPSFDLGPLLLADGYIALAFDLPGKVTDADALAVKNGGSVSWNFKLGDLPATIFAESSR